MLKLLIQILVLNVITLKVYLLLLLYALSILEQFLLLILFLEYIFLILYMKFSFVCLFKFLLSINILKKIGKARKRELKKETLKFLFLVL